MSDALAVIELAYEARGVLAFDLRNLAERERAMKACIEVSLRHLEEFTAPRYQAFQRYLELAVFPEHIDIPLTMLHYFWQATGDLDIWEVDELCIHLHNLSLLLTCDLDKGMIRLHGVMRSYLVQCAGPNMPALHASLLDASQQVFDLKRWADFSTETHYLWQYLIWHLFQASHYEELQATLADLRFLAGKALYVGVSALETDLSLGGMHKHADAVKPGGTLFGLLRRPFTRLNRHLPRWVSIPTVESKVSSFDFFSQTIARLGHLLRQAQTPTEMGGLLLSYLGWNPFFDTQRRTLERELPRPFLTAWHPLPDGSSSPLLRTLQGHTGPVYDCAMSPDSCWIVSASGDHTLKVWDAATGAERLTLSGHTEHVNGCAISPDGRFIVSASDDQTLKVWDAATGAERHTLTGHTDLVSNCAVSPDGCWIVSASWDHMLKVWDATTGAERLSLKGHTAIVWGCAVSPDGRFIVSASDDHTLKVWDAATGVERHTLRGHTKYFGMICMVASCAVSPDSRWIVSASSDDTLKVWDAATGAERHTLRGHTDPVAGCVVSPDGRFIVSASSDRTLKVWNAATGTENHSLHGHTDAVNGCAVSPDGRFIVSASHDHTLKVWTTAGAKRRTFRGHTGLINGCAVSPDGRSIVSASSDDTHKVWNAASGTERLSLKGHTNIVTSCAVSPDSRWIVSASSDDTLKVWDAATGAEHLSLHSNTYLLSSCAVSTDGSWIVSTSLDNTLTVYYEKTAGNAAGSRLPQVAVATRGCCDLAIPREQRLRSPGCMAWDATTGAECLSLKGHTAEVNGCAISPDGHFIISASSDCTLKVWKAQTGQCLLTFPVDGELCGCAFHPDGEHLLACGAQGMYFLRLVMEASC
jgi:WD40 repeat protein